MEEDSGEEVIEDLPDLWVALDVLLVALDELVFADGQVGKYFVIDVNVLLHIFYLILIIIIEKITVCSAPSVRTPTCLLANGRVRYPDR